MLVCRGFTHDRVLNVQRSADRPSLTFDTVRVVRFLLVSDTRSSLCFSKAVKRSLSGNQAKLAIV